MQKTRVPSMLDEMFSHFSPILRPLLDLKVSKEQEEGEDSIYSMAGLLHSIKIRAPIVTFYDVFSRMNVYPVKMQESFIGSNKHMKCIESGLVKRSEIHFNKCVYSDLTEDFQR